MKKNSSKSGVQKNVICILSFVFIQRLQRTDTIFYWKKKCTLFKISTLILLQNYRFCIWIESILCYSVADMVLNIKKLIGFSISNHVTTISANRFPLEKASTDNNRMQRMNVMLFRDVNFLKQFKIKISHDVKIKITV